MQPAPRRLAVHLAAKRVEDLPALLYSRWRAACRHLGQIERAYIQSAHQS